MTKFKQLWIWPLLILLLKRFCKQSFSPYKEIQFFFRFVQNLLRSRKIQFFVSNFIWVHDNKCECNYSHFKKYQILIPFVLNEFQTWQNLAVLVKIQWWKTNESPHSSLRIKVFTFKTMRYFHKNQHMQTVF